MSMTRATEDEDGEGLGGAPGASQSAGGPGRVGLESLGDPKCVWGDVCVPSVVSLVCVVWVPA